MAESLAHRWGQIIGDSFEMFIRNILGEVAERHSLYLDFKHPRATRSGQGKVTWQNGHGNKHDLDYVLERGGTEATLGVPIAFIESAWRRYTRHSKNKVQEIEAAARINQPLSGETSRAAREGNRGFQTTPRGRTHPPGVLDTVNDVESAIVYLIEEENSYRLREDGEQREAFEVQLWFSMGAKIEATFLQRTEAIVFLRRFA